MKQTIRTIIAAAVVCMFVVALAGVSFAADKAKTGTTMPMKAKSNPKGLLDGKHFLGEIGTSDKTTGDKETITFKGGQFHSSACDAKGFSAAPYTATEENGAISFKAECKSVSNGMLQWSGTVKGDNLDASATLVQEGKDPVTMWAKGSSQKMAEHKAVTHKEKSATKATTGGAGQ